MLLDSAGRRLCVHVLGYALAAFAASVPGALWAAAPVQNDEVTPQVERLYAEARAAAAGGDPATAIARYRSMLVLAPHLAAAYNNLGLLLFNTHQYAKAEEVLERGLALHAEMPSAEGMLGMSYMETGDPDKAEKHLQHALARLPNDDKLQLALARDEINLDHLEDAATLLQHFIAQHPDSAEALYLLGNAYLHLSESTFGKLQTEDPNSVYSEEVAGEVDESMRNYPAAIVEYNKAVAQAPAKPGTHMHLANALWLSNQWDRAEEEFRAELKNDPYNCQAAWKLGDSMLQADAPANQALEPLNTAVAQCPNLMQARVDRARALIKDGHAPEALNDLRAAEQQTPSEPSIHFLLAQVYRAEGASADAAQQMQLYAQLEAASRKAAEEQAAAQKAAAPKP